ncbi:MAG TPA: glucans biosynthesis glucosyltransferase MdoH [Kiritimatiellia bacterium]|nr:glucans biosynthesis glucosyltransferase MdoH [Kiritimatiellia bacterium]HPS08864.1 glucans biosynthesis glucosyltransferase MdoH [Kiritimatiellia bacterium]
MTTDASTQIPVQVVNPSRHSSRRQILFFSSVLFLTSVATWLMADILWRGGLTGLETAMLILFVPLFGMVALGFTQAAVGFCVLLCERDTYEIAATLPAEEPLAAQLPATALLIPIYNEDVSRVYEGLRSMYLALANAGLISRFDFFILSDSTDPNKWIEEEVGWIDLCKQLKGFGHIFYRKRHIPLNRKSGNISDFCRRWGKRYRYMVVLDADSLMEPRTLARMVQLMEANPKTGILQTAPQPIQAQTPMARMLQFAGYCYGPIFQAGLNFWQSNNGNFWGHNAIIRTAPFIEHCALPAMPGSKHSRFMSHDYVEAALMRKANYEVWLAYTLGGSFENLPPTMIDCAKRDRRWCRGNFQHSWLLMAQGLLPINRLHLSLGILSYLCSPLWLIFMLLGVIQYRRDMLTPGSSFDADIGISSYLDIGGGRLALYLFLATLAMLTLPKVLATLLILIDRTKRRAFGGGARAVLGFLTEHLFSALMAPILMLFTSLSVTFVLIGREISWGAQRRDAEGIDWPGILRAHAWHTAAGLVAAEVVYRIHPAFFWWMLPVTLGLVFSIPLSALLGHEPFGRFLNRVGLFRTPPETAPPMMVTHMEKNLEVCRSQLPPPEWLQKHYGVAQVVLDPYINAAHVSLLRAKRKLSYPITAYFHKLSERLLKQGPAALNRRELLALLRNADSMTEIHDRLWKTPDRQLPEWWKMAMRHYNILTGRPRTPLYR